MKAERGGKRRPGDDDPKNVLLIQAGIGMQPLTGFSGSVTDSQHRLQCAMRAEPEFTAS